MDTKTAELLLDRIQEEKQAIDWEDIPNPFKSSPSLTSGMLSSGSGPNKPQPPSTLAADLHRQANQKMQGDARSDIIKAVLLAGGAGAAMRGLSGISRLFSGSQRPVPSRTVDMPVMYPRDKEEEKTANNADATSKIGLNYYIPGMLLGAPLAAYGGWKGVDAVLDKQRRKKTEADLNEAKQQYQQALLGSYKQGSDESDPLSALGAVFDDHYDKQADEQPGYFARMIKKYAPNLPGAATGLAAAYAIPASLGGYAAVNSIMKKRSKRALLDKAMKERARRQALQQPAELYAIPTPQDDEPARQ